MKYFILRIVTFTILLGSILCIFKTQVPYYWGRNLTGLKINHILRSPSDYNNLFFGSSATHRHIDPVLFDSITNNKNSSFNVGCPAVFCLEAHYLANHFLESKMSDKKPTIFLEELKPYPIDKRNLHSVERKYFMDFKRLKLGLDYFITERKYLQAYYHTIAFIENQLCIGELKKIIKYRNKRLSNKLIEQKGYYPKDQQMIDENVRKMAVSRKKYMQSLKGNKKSRLVPDSKKIITLTAIDENSMFYLGDENNVYTYNYIELEPRYHFEKGHFNSKGAKVFTEKIANAYLTLEQ